MIVANIDLGGDATRVAAEGQAALAVGNTDLARERFKEAGDLLESKIGGNKKPAVKHLTRFLAASQYYHGGDYQTALKLARKVEVKYLPQETQALFGKFIRDVNERAEPDYEERVRKQLLEQWQRKDYPAFLAILQEHPYVIPQAKLALLRAFCFEELRDWHAAAVFFADALKGMPDDPETMALSCAYPLVLARENNLPEAWKYAQFQLKAMPNAITFITASMLRFHQATATKDARDAENLLREQIQYFDDAWAHYQQLPTKVRDYQDIRKYMVLCFEAAVMGFQQAGEQERARQTCDQAILFAPNEAELRTIRGYVLYPSDQALDDFREAIRLGDQTFFPYYFLAHHALVSKQFSEAVSWCRQSLERHPSRPIAAQLHFWLAMAQHHLGSSSEEVQSLLVRAWELDPDNQPVQRNAEQIAQSVTPSLGEPSGTNGAEKHPLFREYLEAQQAILLRRRARTAPVERELAAAGA